MPLSHWQQLLEDWGWPCLILAVGIFLALIIERVVRTRLRAWAAAAQWQGAEIIAHAARSMLFLWLSLVAVVVASENALLFSEANKEHVRILTKVVLISSATIVVSRVLGDWLRLHLRNMPGLGATSIVANVSRILVWMLGLLVIFQTLGINITPVLGALGVGGLAVALALQETLTNLFSGLQLIITRQIRAGDYIHINGGEEGFVSDIGWRHTTLRSIANNLVVVPNSKLASSIVINFSLPDPWMWLTLTIGVSYDSDLPRVEAIAREELDAVLPQDARAAGLVPTVYFHTFADSSILGDLRLPVSQFRDQFDLRHRLVMRLQPTSARRASPSPSPPAP